MKTYRTLMACASVMGLLACNSKESEVTTVGNPSGDAVFYDAIQEVAPSFEMVRGASSLTLKAQATTAWEVGNPLYEIFTILRDFNPDTDAGVIDTSNLYKTMWEGRNFLANTKTECAAITEQVITPPFDFGNPPTTYHCAFNEEAEDGYDFGGAVKELDADGNILSTEEAQSDTEAPIKQGLFGFVWPGDSHNEYGTLQGSLDGTTNDLAIDIAVWVDYEGENDYCYRNDIDGNTETHEFALRSMKGNRVSSNSLSVVGKGFSQGAGQYFLLKVMGSGLPSSRYYCIGAEDGETELQAMDGAGLESVDPNCAGFQEAVDALTPFTTADLACASSDFNPGGTGTATEGTIFLNFE